MTCNASYSLLKHSGSYKPSNINMAPNTVIVPQYGAISYSTLQRNPEGSCSNYRTIETAYGPKTMSENGRYVVRYTV